MRRNPNKKTNSRVNSFTKDLQKFIEDQKSVKEKNQDFRKKIVSLGAFVKKEQLNFKEIKKLKEEKKIKTSEKKFKNEQAGIKETRRRRK